jgi:ATP-dependent DNA ligase
MVVLLEGKPDFGLLQSREHSQTPLRIRSLARSTPATLIVFDLPYLEYHSLMKRPLERRREQLRGLVQKYDRGRLVLSEGIVGRGEAFFREACRQGLEGVIAKRLKSHYLPGRRTDAWIKIKRSATIDCAIIGFVPSDNVDFRSLILAAEDQGKLRCIGKVGTGFPARLRRRLNKLLWARLRDKPLVPCRIKGNWVEPGLYCRVSCMERTASGDLRAPVFEELIEE